MKKPRIAIITDNVLEGIGMKSLLSELIPFAEICCFDDWTMAMKEDAEGSFFHFFVAASLYNQLQGEILKRHTILFGNTQTIREIPSGLHTLNTSGTTEELIRSLMMLQDGAHHQFSHYPQDISQKLRQEDEQQTALLTQREMEILKMVALGKTSKEIAEELHISLHTVHTHRKNIMDKLQAHSATKIMAYAMNHNLIT